VRQKSAFSLIELSISILVISIIMAGVAGSIKMAASTRLTNARSITANSLVPKIDGLVAWYETSRLDSFKPSEAVEDGQISAWYDTSSGSITKQKNPLTRTASTAVIYQSSGINKLPSISFNGTNSITLTNFYQGISSQNTIFIVANPSTLTTVLIDSSASGSTTSIGQNSNAISMNLGSSVATGTVTNPVTNLTNTPYIVAVYLNGSSSKAYFNDASNMAGGSTINPGTASLTGLTIGSTKTNTLRYSGLISEVIIYNRPLQTQERKDVMKYLGQKYGITVAGI
jgi:prepilin-type N-terminal cleavage/methylation domain-containing protein